MALAVGVGTFLVVPNRCPHSNLTIDAGTVRHFPVVQDRCVLYEAGRSVVRGGVWVKNELLADLGFRAS